MNFISLIISFIINFSLIITNDRKFVIDYENNRFLKDGQPFRYVSGSLHYFRVPSVLWADRMTKYRAAGLNAIQTYIEWSLHEPERGFYDFDGDKNLFEFLEIANEQNLSVILRPGPFIDAERDFGGFPYWLLSIDPNMKLRRSDPKYINELDKWFSYLLPKLRPYLYSNGGPIIMVQVENEYGSHGNYECDFVYLTHLRDFFRNHLGNDVILFTTDNDRDSAFECGKIDGVFATVDFGNDSDPNVAFDIQRRHQQFGPNVNSEFYSGWLDYWERPHSTTNSSSVCRAIDRILALNASVNVYVFHGGTSFGFTAGSNIDSDAFYACPTSYDYDAPLNEAGDPTQKYYDMRKIIGKYMPLPDIPVPMPSPKMETSPIQMTPIITLLEYIRKDKVISSLYPQTFEQLRQPNGFVLYSTNISVHPSDPAVLSVMGLGDRAQVFVDWEFMGTLSRTHKLFQIPINIKINSSLQILVENQGRICSGSALIGDFKGITSNVTLGPIVLKNWDHLKIRFNNFDSFKDMYIKVKGFTSFEQKIPTFYWSQFQLSADKQLFDTFLNVDGWGKGIAFLNGFNLGRYWPVSGPELTLYAPKHLFNPYPEMNQLVLFELENSPCRQSNNCTVRFVKTHVINGSTPYQTSDNFNSDDNTLGFINSDIQLTDIQYI